jgi:hypothetical protein
VLLKTVEEEPEGSETRSATGGAQEGAWRPWWRRVLGRYRSGTTRPEGR